MFRVLLEEIVVPVLIFLVVRAMLGNLFSGFRGRARSASPVPQPPPTVQVGGELRKDPVCGTYVSASSAVTRNVNGQTLYFCSPECRDRYRA